MRGSCSAGKQAEETQNQRSRQAGQIGASRKPVGFMRTNPRVAARLASLQDSGPLNGRTRRMLAGKRPALCRNPKAEIRNPKEARNPMAENRELPLHFRASGFGFLSDFEFRPSNFSTPAADPNNQV
jgi:hypothetical protein